MRVGFVADVHLGLKGGKVTAGISEHTRYRLNAFEHALQVAKAESCAYLYVAGDLLDSVRPEPQLLAEIQRLCRGFQGPSGEERIIALRGNHETVSSLAGDHALGPLHGIGAAVVDNPRYRHHGDVTFLEVPYMPGPPATEWLPMWVRHLAPRRASGLRVLVTHVGLYDPGVLKAMRIPPDVAASMKGAVPVSLVQELMQECGIDVVLSGDWHSRRWWSGDGSPPRRGYALDGGLICQIGALAPTGYDDKGPLGALLVLDTTDRHVEIHEIPGPRFFQTDSIAKLHKARDLQVAGNQVYVRLTVPPADLDVGKETIRRMVEAGACVAGETIADDTEVKEAAKEAAQAAASVETLEAGLPVFVENLMLPENVDKNDVTARCRRYLGL